MPFRTGGPVPSHQKASRLRVLRKKSLTAKAEHDCGCEGNDCARPKRKNYQSKDLEASARAIEIAFRDSPNFIDGRVWCTRTLGSKRNDFRAHDQIASVASCSPAFASPP